jgi:hypothetical protein
MVVGEVGRMIGANLLHKQVAERRADWRCGGDGALGGGGERERWPQKGEGEASAQIAKMG